MKIKEVLSAIEQFAPIQLQENFDNCGVQVGDVNNEAKAALLCIDVTESVIDEAIGLGCNLVISHHPLAFRSFKSLTGKNYIERCLMKACKHDIVVYAAHTNIDNAGKGINDYLARMLGLQNVRILMPMEGKLNKLVTYVPADHAETVRNALFSAGAGNIGNYDRCSFNSEGFGTFRGNEESSPFCGLAGTIHNEDEVRIEVIMPSFKQNEVVRNLIAVHPYEEPAYDVFGLNNSWVQHGAGIVGTLPEEMDEEDFLYLLKDTFHLQMLQHSNYCHKSIRDVALCSGSGAFLIPKAIAYGADVFITGEAKYNDFYDVEDKILLAVTGHYESEIFTKNVFFDLLSKKFPTFELFMSGTDTNPVSYL